MTETIERLLGTVSAFDTAKRTGLITDLSGADHIIMPGSFRRTVLLAVGDRVSFSSFHLSNGPTAQNIEPIEPTEFLASVSRGPMGPTDFRGTRAHQIPHQVEGLSLHFKRS